MTIFYIDTTSRYLYTGVVQNNNLLIERKEDLNRDLSIFTVEYISKMFEEVHLMPKDIDKIIVVNGPGSFTGIRIGVTLAKIYACCLEKEITTISSLEAMAKSIETDKLIVPIIDARRGYVYATIYDSNDCLLEECYISLEKLLLILKELKKEYIFISNDNFSFECKKYNPNILRIVNYYKDRESINYHAVNPKYLKLTEAEENKMKEEVHDC